MFWDIFEFVGSIAMGWILGRMLIEYVNRKAQYVSTEDLYLIKLKAARIFYIEQVGEQYMLYDALNDLFVCQATNLDDLAVKCFQYAKVKLAVVKFDYNYMCFNQGRVITDFDDIQ